MTRNMDFNIFLEILSYIDNLKIDYKILGEWNSDKVTLDIDDDEITLIRSDNSWEWANELSDIFEEDNSNEITQKIECYNHEFIPMFNTICCKYCGIDKDKVKK